MEKVLPCRLVRESILKWKKVYPDNHRQGSGKHVSRILLCGIEQHFNSPLIIVGSKNTDSKVQTREEPFESPVNTVLVFEHSIPF